MVYNPWCPLKNFSHNGAKITGPLVKNMKAILGTRLNGYSLILGSIDAVHKSCSSFIPCIKVGGCWNSTWLEVEAFVIVGLGGDGGGGCSGDDDDDCDVKMENWPLVTWRLSEKFL